MNEETNAKPMNLISLGAGVQSSTMALMAAHGELTPMPEGAIFADTCCEPLAVYHWLAWLEKQLPFPVYRVVEKRGLLHHIMRSVRRHRFAGAPFFTESTTEAGMLRRQCTSEFKIKPMLQKVRELIGLRKGQRGQRHRIQAVQWIGISVDEATRMKPSRVHWIERRWPLVEIRMSRNDCLKWLKKRNYPLPPPSACTFCPYHSDAEWRHLTQDLGNRLSQWIG